jgi:hypothetical protein
MGKNPPLNFRYRGPMNWPKLYKGTLQFFRERECEVQESTYKDKTNEFEGIIKAERMVDMYNKFEYEIVFKAFDMNPTAKEGIFNGKLILVVNSELSENYELTTPAGKGRKLFEEDSWLHKMYKKVVMRDQEEIIEDECLGIAQRYIEWLKEQCGMDMKYG